MRMSNTNGACGPRCFGSEHCTKEGRMGDENSGFCQCDHIADFAETAPKTLPMASVRIHPEQKKCRRVDPDY